MFTQSKEIDNTFSALCNLVYANRLKEALSQLRILMEDMHVADFTLQYEDIYQTYRMLLEYNFRGVADPQRNTIFAKLEISLLELADKVRQHAFAQTGMHIYQLKSRIEKEKEIFSAQAAESGKPADIIEKMVVGRISKFLAEITLLGQPFIKDDKLTVAKLLASKGNSVIRFARLEVGEGIEKKEENFAEEVMAQVRGN